MLQRQFELTTEHQLQLAREGLRSLESLREVGTEAESFRVQIVIEHRRQRVTLPSAVRPAILRLLECLSQGHRVAVAPIEEELTTQEAADFLQVSRPFLIKLLERGPIPFHMVGTHRRVLYKDVVEYKLRRQGAREDTLRGLVAEAQALGLGY